MMLLMNGVSIPDPQEMRVRCLPQAGGGLIREVEAAWLEVPQSQAAAILGPCAAQVNLTFTDPMTGGRLTLPMLLTDSQARLAREDGAGAVYARLSLTLREG